MLIQDDPIINKIRKDCERKEEFLKSQTLPSYLSSPPKEVDRSPYGIASLANTMPPPKEEIKGSFRLRIYIYYKYIGLLEDAIIFRFLLIISKDIDIEFI